ncbi:MAG: hypothetical protein QM791_19525 [Ferruginibacter sp.]
MNNEITTMAELNARIKELEGQEALQMLVLKEQATELMQSLKPSALMKSAVSGLVFPKDPKSNIMDTSIAAGAGFIARKIYEHRSKSIFKKLTGFLLQRVTAGFVSKKMPVIREKIAHL